MSCFSISMWLTTRWKAPHTEECADSLEPFIAHFAIAKTEPLELRPVGAESWQALASSVYRLYRDGYSVCVPARWVFMVGDDLSCSPLKNEGATPRRFSVMDPEKRPGAVSAGAFQVGNVAWKLRAEEEAEQS
jgi:hypothetical protein